MRTALISSTDQLGWSCRRIAAAPATWGEDIEVPEREVAPVPLPASTERMAPPGAVMSGLRAESPNRGPREVKDWSRSGIGRMFAGSSVNVVAGVKAARI